MTGFVQTEEHYHLCPICGCESKTTSRICPEHSMLMYDSMGKLSDANYWYPNSNYIAKIPNIKAVK